MFGNRATLPVSKFNNFLFYVWDFARGFANPSEEEISQALLNAAAITKTERI